VVERVHERAVTVDSLVVTRPERVERLVERFVMFPVAVARFVLVVVRFEFVVARFHERAVTVDSLVVTRPERVERLVLVVLRDPERFVMFPWIFSNAERRVSVAVMVPVVGVNPVRRVERTRAGVK